MQKKEDKNKIKVFFSIKYLYKKKFFLEENFTYVK
jgi:hypothetical protein